MVRAGWGGDKSAASVAARCDDGALVNVATGEFDTVAFYLTDVAGVGGKSSIKAGDSSFTDIAGGKRLANCNNRLGRLALSELVDSLTITLGHDRTNDGFGIDGVNTGLVAPVQIPRQRPGF